MSEYTVRTWYSYNAFHADEHYCVGLFRDGQRIGVWAYSTFLSSSLAHRRAEGRIARLRSAYGAEIE
jgi:hypothetical protein